MNYPIQHPSVLRTLNSSDAGARAHTGHLRLLSWRGAVNKGLGLALALFGLMAMEGANAVPGTGAVTTATLLEEMTDMAPAARQGDRRYRRGGRPVAPASGRIS
jgi:hypothetical protein